MVIYPWLKNTTELTIALPKKPIIHANMDVLGSPRGGTPTGEHEINAQDGSPINFSPSPDFCWLCDELFIKLEEVALKKKDLGKPRKVRNLEITSNFVSLWRKTVGNDIYPALVLSLPYNDRRSYRVKDVTLVKALCKHMKLPRNSETERRLLHWKQNAPRGVKLSTFCVEELQKRRREPVVPKRMSIDEVNGMLDKLEHESNVGKWSYISLAESPAFNYCLEHMSYVELRFFFDIVLKVPIVSGLESLLLSCWHPDAESYFKVVSDLRIVAHTLYDPNERLEKNDLSVRIGYAFAPHMAQRVKIPYEKVSTKLGNDFYVEEKMDGDRIQVHYMDYGNSIAYFSRNGINYTYLYGENSSKGSISNHLKFVEGVKECILDGEMVSYDKEMQCILPFGLTKSGASHQVNFETTGHTEPTYRPLYAVFDLLYLNGQLLTNQDVVKRKEYLEKILIPSKNVVHLLSGPRCSDAEAITAALGAAVAHGSEGIVLKKARSKYSVGKRDDSWIKIKPEYLENFGENMDLVVIGRDKGRKDSFICALAVTDDSEKNNPSSYESGSDSDSDSEPIIVQPKIEKFISFCSIANGISNEEFKEIDRLTRGNWFPYDERKPPTDWVEFGTKTPREWIDPKNSVVLEVKARSIDNEESKSDLYKTGSTLYNAYCKRIRHDKNWSTASTVAEYDTAREARSYFNVSQNAKFGKDRSSPRKRRTFHLVGDIDVTKPSKADFLKGYYFYVTSGYFDLQSKKNIDASEIGEAVVSCGGTYIHNLRIRASLDKLYILGCKDTRELKMLIERGYDIIHPEWLMDCVKYGTMLQIEPKYVYSASEELMKQARNQEDKYGESYQLPVTEDTLKALANKQVEEGYASEMGTDAVSEYERLLIFKGWLFYILDDYAYHSSWSDIVKWNIESCGGEVTNDLELATIVVAVKDCFSQLSLQAVRNNIGARITGSNDVQPIPKIVTSEWVEACMEAQYLVDEDEYAAI
ncbi:ACR008Wp [Eremothecium gossypii ATCC 10895]|uniref:DNA ligase 4 n=1 Tax=Eremothecium gossypii (strain ATCC 10895 / CBS 109.51 / FGSC 9923 / NRRL Y-1056) TaxID=284811 RepID=DNLI4_EREGS|nr:ACR008Wp [Eremothecium gossypii ATCC 10895]Q75CA4.1 RecName: Full=DNA ligase 4; AltName: Full=DNA ligase IV; AltName: Full=Polydeoxyribonucleotide synthase [ATP] 4 [Eremothecium gossypii ATCC 10895]AAS51235.1 ACR008Wp [Eremothecium gossypii ATCC 10895]